jgi:lipopolysaccharide export system permease protein
MSILSRYLVRETGLHTAAGFLVVLGVFLLTRLSRLLGDAAVGELPGKVVLELLALRTVMALPSLLPAVLYVGILLGLSRLSRDAELMSMEACGVSPRRVYGAVLLFAAAVASGIAILSFTGRPWAAARFNAVRDQAVTEAGLDAVRPGTFVELDPEQHQVLFAESRSASQPEYLEDVFVQQRTKWGISVYHAARALESRDLAAGARFLTLFDGVEYDLDPDGDDHEVSRYETLTLRAELPAPEPDLGPEKTLSLSALLNSGDLESIAELQWRSAMPVSAVLLALLAVRLGRGAPGRGRYAMVVPALLLYLVYRSLLGTAKNWVADGTLPAVPGVWLVHAACLLLVMILMLRAPVLWRGRAVRLLTSPPS